MPAKSILVAEDDRFLMKVYSAKFEKEGYAVITANDGVETVQRAKAKKPDLILLDMIMPRKNGFDVLADLRADAATKKIPVIILSNLGSDDDVKRAMEMGANDYLVKANTSIKQVMEKVKKFV